jgi:hypothetical protein
MPFDFVRQRCAVNKPVLGDAITHLAGEFPSDAQPLLWGLATEVYHRTTLRPETVTLESVGAALLRLLGHMLDRPAFVCRHAVALRYFGVRE